MRNFHFLKFLLFLALISAFILPFFGFSAKTLLAQSDNSGSQNEAECQSREECENLLKKYEEEISQLEKDISKTQQEKKTLQNQISILKKKIEKLNLQIQQGNAMIGDITIQIKDTGNSIEKTTLKIEDSRGNLADLLKLIYQEDQKSLVEILISSDKISDFFSNLTALEEINSKSRQLISDIKELKVSLEEQKQSLDGEKDDLEKIAKIQILQRAESMTTRKDQEKLLEQTKGKESEYQKLLTTNQKKAAEIRARIFELMGVPQAPTFGEALDIAKFVSNITGVRPAFLLAILEQESAIGKNVGQCYLADKNTGAGIRVSNGEKAVKTMHPTRDVPHFLNITTELGRDPFKTLVSCPMSFGWGGAMGPAQFIPSTWVLYDDKVKEIIQSADPWSIKDSFLAAALYLADYGATKKTRNAEWRAAMIYFSGSTSSRYSFYGNSVLSRADKIEGWIQDIEKASQ